MAAPPPPIYTGDHVDDDLATIERMRPSHGPLLNAFLDDLAEREEARWTMLKRNGFSHDPHFNCDPVEHFQGLGYNIYRVRPLLEALRRYRILYAYDTRTDELHLLAVVEKLPLGMTGGEPWSYYGYEPDHPVSKRAIDEYDECGFQRLRAR